MRTRIKNFRFALSSLLAAGVIAFAVAGCGGGTIELLEVQLEGKKRMAGTAFLNGFSIAAGEVLG